MEAWLKFVSVREKWAERRRRESGEEEEMKEKTLWGLKRYLGFFEKEI